MPDTTTTLPALPDCDICKLEFAMATPNKARYDGKTIIGQWGYMCEEHFSTVGIGLGLGKGQRIITPTDTVDLSQHECTPACPFFSPVGFHLDHPRQVEPSVSQGELDYWEDMASDTNAKSQRRMERRGMTD